MLVYLNQPMGLTSLDGYKVTGECYNYGRLGPTNIPRSVYLKYRDRLIEVPITTEWLEKTFGGKFPQIEFTTNELNAVEWTTLINLANLMGIPYVGSNRKTTEAQRRALRRAVIKRIENPGENNGQRTQG